MDYARKIGKKEPKFWLTKPVTAVETTDTRSRGLLDRVESSTEDRRLQNWNKWLAERRKISHRIKALTGRERIDQVLNSCEKVRSVVEMKTLMENASIPLPVIPDKYRGGPEFWNLTESLPNRGDPCLPEITAVPTKKDLNLPPDLTYVDVPKPIEKEKGLLGISSKEIPWERSSYLRQREEELDEEIKLLMPKRPETKELMIIGKAFEEPKKQPRIPVISISTPEEEESPDDIDLAIILKIQDREIVWKRSLFKSDKPNKEPIEWSLIFRGIVDQRTEQKIVFENKGNTAIHYLWRDSSFQSKFLSFQRHVSPFYFDKTNGVILQGQIVEHKIWYLPRSTSVFTESWRLFTDPKLCHSPLIFRFWGSAEKTIDGRSSIVSGIDRYLDHCIRDSIIREIIETIMANVDHKKPPDPAYGSLFLESEVFKAKNPYHFYHPNLVLELRKLYCEVVDQSTSDWSLSLDDLRTLLLLIKEPERRQKILQRFNDLYHDCLRPILNPTFVNDRKYAIVYNLLCSFTNRFEIESEFVMNNCAIGEVKVSASRSEMSTVSQTSVKSSDKQRRKSKKGSNEESSNALMAESSVSLVQEDAGGQPYKEIFFVRVYGMLCETIERIFAAIDSLNRLDGVDK